MKKVVLILWVILACGLPLSLAAQNKAGKSNEQRKAQYEQFCQFRRDYMTKQIGLTEQEAEEQIIKGFLS